MSRRRCVTASHTHSQCHPTTHHTHAHTYTIIPFVTSKCAACSHQVFPLDTHTHVHMHTTHTVSPLCKTFLQMPNVAFGHISETDRWIVSHAGRQNLSHSSLCGCLLIIGDKGYKLMLIFFYIKVEKGNCKTKCQFSFIDKMEKVSIHVVH